MKKGLLIIDNPKFGTKTIYDTQETENQIRLIYSKIDSTWNHPGEPAYTLINTGNYFIFKDYTLKQQVKLDYSQAQAIRAMLHIEDVDKEKLNFFELKS